MALRLPLFHLPATQARNKAPARPVRRPINNREYPSQSLFNRKERKERKDSVHPPLKDARASASGYTGPLPWSCNKIAANVIVHRESTTSSTKRTGAGDSTGAGPNAEPSCLATR